MTGGVHVRGAAAVRTAVLWVSLCMLLQHLGHHPQFTAEAQGSVQVNILRYFTFDNNVFLNTPGGRVNYGNSVTACSGNGGSLVTGQSAAAQSAITAQLKSQKPPLAQFPPFIPFSNTYMGGDATYSINSEPILAKRCIAGTGGASINCIYRWNSGLFASGEYVGKGVPFYRGSLFSLPGAGPVNGYPPFWQIYYPAHGNPYVISRYGHVQGARSKWYDTTHDAIDNTRLPPGDFVVVCEVQETTAGSTPIPTPIPTTTPVPTTTTTTTIPPAAASESSWIKKHWYVPLIIALVVLAAIIGLIILCCCLGGRDDEKYLYPMATREASDVPLHAREITDDDDDYYNDNDRDVSMVPSEPMPMEDIESANVSVYSVAENNVYGDGDVFSKGNR
ncbi:uncharacterized protein TM35_000401460 [Trypanosoma theileri]|uniref:Uncharacterized protein n=1 Tax=Trypanosoma theileri TaxID=67003 RepID=A0A1X0NL44_9TRYP|nr:uncharacterized protein TM35_000401460 [Trypanosoma theileri]ORC84879.1 hypothetical protein TM35_000401460 [Trypanosoma theileri]